MPAASVVSNMKPFVRVPGRNGSVICGQSRQSVDGLLRVWTEGTQCGSVRVLIMIPRTVLGTKVAIVSLINVGSWGVVFTACAVCPF